MPENLSTEEGFLLSRVEDGIRIADLIPLCPWDEKGTIAYIKSLLDAGVIEIIDRSNALKTVGPETDDQTYIHFHLKHDEDDEHLKNLDIEFRKNVLNKYHQPEDTNPFDILETYPQAPLFRNKKAIYFAFTSLSP